MNKPALISVEDLEQLLRNPKLILFDATIDKVNQKIDNNSIKLIPKSLFLDIENDFSDKSSGLPHTMIDQQTFTNKVQQLGVNDDSIIVIYDRWGVYSSPRAWWMFKYMGFEDVFVLDGGLPAWEAQALAIDNKHHSASSMGNFTAQQKNNWFADKANILQNINKLSARIIDARGTGRFQGISPEPRQGVRSGHIPNSKNLPFEEVLEEMKMRHPNELKMIFKNYGEVNDHYIFTCGSGITASILALAAHQADLKNITVYDGSWTEWGSDQSLPLEN